MNNLRFWLRARREHRRRAALLELAATRGESALRLEEEGRLGARRVRQPVDQRLQDDAERDGIRNHGETRG